MLTYRQSPEGHAIARVLGERVPAAQQIIYIKPDSPEAKAEIEYDPAELLDFADWCPDKSKKAKISAGDRQRLLMALRCRAVMNVPDMCPDNLATMYTKVQEKVDDRSKKRIALAPPNFISIIPSDLTERIFIAGKSGAGKSTLARRYMIEYLAKFPGRRVVLISRHEGEATYADVPHLAIILNEEFTAGPPTVEMLQGSLVVFDDCDNLQNKKLSEAVFRLNGDIISNGRKYDIHTMFLGHQLMNYKATRDLLNEANKVIFFNMGAAYHNTRYMKEYAGVTPQTIKVVNRLPSRWVCLCHGFGEIPMYFIHEHGVLIPSD